MVTVGAISDNSSINTEAEQYYILQFKGAVLNHWESELVNSGVNVVDYLPGNSFIVRMNSSVMSEIESLDFVLKVDGYQASIRNELEKSNEYGTFSTMSTTQKEVFLVVIFDSRDMVRISSQVEGLGGVILDSSPNRMKVEIMSKNAEEMASIPGIRLIEKFVEHQFFNDVAAGILNVDLVHNDYGLNGIGEIVAVCDTGIDTGINDNTMHADLRGRIINITDFSNNGPADLNGHGTHVAGSVLGNGDLSGGQYKGMAPESLLVFQAIESSGGLDLPLDLIGIFQPAYDLGARIHTNSWGAPTNGSYTEFSRQVDNFSWHHPDMLIIFAAGNEGIDYNEDGVIDLDSMASPGTAKNCLTVGASENYRPSFSDSWGIWQPSVYPINPIKDDLMANNTEGIAAFSSRGPTDDGRIKPDVVAPGTFVNSIASSLVYNSTNYTYMSGTSMATPLTAGTAALVRQYYNETENLQNPSAALIKATLIHHAHDMTPGQYGIDSTQEVQSKPDYSQGWGRVDIAGLLDPQYPEVSVYFDKINLNTSESWNVSYDYIKAGENFSSTLVWTDYPGASLVNNLDLALKANNSTYFGNGGSETDTINNVERIELNTPASDTYMIYINGTNVTTTLQGQNFSLLASFTCNVNEFPQNDSHTNDGNTGLDLIHPDGVNVSSVNMMVDNTLINVVSVPIISGYKIQNDTILSYTKGIHNVSVNALTDEGKNISFDWSFYYDVQSPVITIVEPVEKEVFQNNTFKINISTDKSGYVWYNINNGVNTSPLSTTSLIDTLVLDEGHYVLNAFALDNAGNSNFTSVNFTVFTELPSIDTPSSGTIFYIPNSDIEVNGTAGIASNISVYVNGAITNTSSVSNGLFNVSGIPISNGTNIINISSSFNNSQNDYLSSNVSFNVILGETLNATEHMEIHVPGWESNASNPLIDFNVSGISATIPDNISVALSVVTDPQNGHTLVGPMVDIRVLNGSDPDYSYVFDQIVSLTLGYDVLLVNDTDKLVLAWHDPAAQMWIPLKSAINVTSMSVSANLTHLSVYAPLEDDLAPVISDLASSVSSSSVTLSWDSSEDTDHVEIWRDNSSLINSSDSGITDSGLSSETFYTYQLRPVDCAGNIGNWSYINATTSKKPTSSSSGGSGGGGSTTNEYFENIYHKEVVTEYISHDVETTFTFKEGARIDYITLLTDSNVGSVKAIIEVLINTSTLVPDKPDGVVYQNLNIWVGNFGLKNNIVSSSVGFRVRNDWIEENGFAADSISMKMYYNDAWVALPTTIVGEEDEFIHYETYTGVDILAPFAIVGQLPADGTDPRSFSSDSNSIAGASSLDDGSSTVSDEGKGQIYGILQGFIDRITDLFSKLFGI